jgi:hypothetical protein
MRFRGGDGCCGSDEETEVGQYFHADDGGLDVGHHETPSEIAA